MSVEQRKFKKLKELFPQISDLELLEIILENSEERKYKKKMINNIKNNKELINFINNNGQSKKEKDYSDLKNITNEEIDFIESIEEISDHLLRKKKIIRYKEPNKRVLYENNKYSWFNFNEHQTKKKYEEGIENKDNLNKALDFRKKSKEIRIENSKLINKYNLNNNIPSKLIIESCMQSIDYNNLTIKELDREAINNLIKNNELINQNRKIKDILIIDLHNFTLNEAIIYAKDILFGIKLRIKGIENLSEDKRNRNFRYKKLEFITGRSKKSYKIRPAIINLLNSNGFTYFECGPKILVNLF